MSSSQLAVAAKKDLVANFQCSAQHINIRVAAHSQSTALVNKILHLLQQAGTVCCGSLLSVSYADDP